MVSGYVTDSDYPLKSTSDSVTYPETTPIKSIYDDEIDNIPKLFHSDNDDDIFDVDLQMLQTCLAVDPY